MKDSDKLLNLLGVGLNSELAHRIVAADYSLTKLKQVSKSHLLRHFSEEDVDLIVNAVKRKPIQENTLNKLIEECDWKCCVCWNYRETSPVIIHHIEPHSKTADDSYENLVVLCLNHHGEAHSKWQISRHPLPPELIRAKKKDWVRAVADFKAGLRSAPGSELSESAKEWGFQEKQKKRDTLRDFLANDLQRMGELIVGGAYLKIKITSQPKLAKLLDELIRKTTIMKVMFITDEELCKTFSELGGLGRLAWDNQITKKQINHFLDCEHRLENALASLEEELLK